MNTEGDTALLKCIFTKILRDGLDYCSLCFHTSDERRLVEPHYFKLYLEATKLQRGPTPLAICYICERRSKHALEVFTRARYSASVRLILEVLLRRHVSEERVIFDQKYFKKLLNGIHLDSSSYTPELIENHLQGLRLNDVIQSDMELTDSTTVYSCTGTVTGMSCRKEKKRIIPTVKYQPIAPRPDANPPAKTAASTSQLNKTVDLPLPKNPKPQNYIPCNLSLLTKEQTLEPGATPQVPKVITVKDITELNSGSTAKFILHSVYKVGDNKYAVPSLSADIIDNTICFYDAYRNVISTQALEIDALIKQTTTPPTNQKPGFLTCQTNVKHHSGEANLPNVSCQTNVTTDSCQTDVPAVPSDNNVVVLYNNEIHNKNATFDGKVISCLTRNSAPSTTSAGVVETPSKRKKLNNRKTWPRISDVKIMDISSDMDNVQDVKRATDWEDKIPMDVISFMDAVDPHADKAFIQPMIQPLGPLWDIQIGEPRSLANEEEEQGIHSDIIDLCETDT